MVCVCAYEGNVIHVVGSGTLLRTHSVCMRI